MSPKNVGIVLILVMVVLAGCWSAKEINELAFVMSIGIDALPDSSELFFAFRVANPTALAGGESGGAVGAAQGQSPTFPVGVRSSSLAEALDIFRTQVPRRPFLSHIQGIFIGEDLAKQGVAGILDALGRYSEIRRTIEIMVVADGPVADVFLKPKPTLVTPSGISFDGLLHHVLESGHGPVVPIGEFDKMVGSARQDAMATVVKLSPDMESWGEERSSAVAALTQLRIAGTALFRGDRLVGYLDVHETVALLLLRGELTRANVTLEEGAVVRIISSASSVRVTSTNPLRFAVDVNVAGVIRELRAGGMHSLEKAIGELERSLEQSIQGAIEAVIQKAQSLQSDVVLLGDTLFRSHPRVWREVEDRWPDYFAAAEVEVSVRARILETGNLTTSITIPRAEKSNDPSPSGKGFKQ